MSSPYGKTCTVSGCRKLALHGGTGDLCVEHFREAQSKWSYTPWWKELGLSLLSGIDQDFLVFRTASNKPVTIRRCAVRNCLRPAMRMTTLESPCSTLEPLCLRCYEQREYEHVHEKEGR